MFVSPQHISLSSQFPTYRVNGHFFPVCWVIVMSKSPLQVSKVGWVTSVGFGVEETDNYVLKNAAESSSLMVVPCQFMSFVGVYEISLTMFPLFPLFPHIRPFRTNTPKICPFHYRGLECKSRKLRNTWSNRQIWPWNVEWSTAKTNRVLPRKCTGPSKHPLPTTQEKLMHMDLIRWSTPKSDWLYSLQPKMKKLCTVKELTVAQITNSLLPNSDLNWRK